MTRIVLSAGLAAMMSTAIVGTASAKMPGPSSMVGEGTIMVGDAPMYPTRNIIQNAIHSRDHTTLVELVKAAGLVHALEGMGPFTVFAPTNEAFADLPAGTVQSLMKPKNKADLVKILEYHVVPGDYNTTKLRSMILSGGGKATLKTLEGGTLTVMMNGSSNIIVKDEKGGVADITVADVHQSNGVIQVIDHVLMP
ncbi:MAG: fasciclin domain-containing protein [Steroidobacteraceae bacterium]